MASPDLDEALGYHKQALLLYEQAGDEGSRLNELHFLGETYRDRGDYDEGQRVLEETAALVRARGLDQQLTRRVQLYCIAGIACARLQQGDPCTAARL